jgi:ERCC4-type nuclease
VLIAPTEPKALRELGTVNLAPERLGVDILWGVPQVGLVGVQRKVFPGDFLASMDDGRLAKEVSQMRGLNISVLLLEGRGTWTTDGQLVTRWGKSWTRQAHRRFLYTLRSHGVWVEWTDHLEDTIACLADLENWAAKTKHTALSTRPAPKRDSWGRLTDRDYALHLIQSLPDVGPELAARIYESFGVPLKLSITETDLLTVHGIGKAKAKRIVRVFDGG